MTPLIPLTRDLVLVGGGHAHALFLRMWGMNPVAGVRVTVINPGPTAPYTGMLPGFVAGHYEPDELEIDLVKLCRFAGARLILGKAIGLDRNAKRVEVVGRPAIAYDVLSIDIGIHSDMPEIEGFQAHAQPVKPLHAFAQAWDAFVEAVAAGKAKPEAVIIGGGIGGAELVLAMDYKLRAIGAAPKLSLIEAQSELTGVSAGARAKLKSALADAEVSVHLGATVERLDPDGVVVGGTLVPSHFTVGAAGAKPYGWLAQTGLPLEEGYISVNETLAVLDDPDVFAAGDCAHLSHAPRPKAGVFAVRAAPVLFHNIKARLTGGRTRSFKPQKTYLKLISLGRKSAIAEKASWALRSDLMWVWKNRIDQKFMNRFRDLPAMAVKLPSQDAAIGVVEILADKPLCGGCGAKVGAGVLDDALCALPENQRADVLSKPGDDAAVLQIGGHKQVVSVDHLRAFDEDQWRIARIATVHALGDIWAMGADPQSVLVSLVMPRMSAELQKRTLNEIMDGLQSIAGSCGAEIVGGHTSMGAELTIGLTVTGLLEKSKDAIEVSGARVGDALILTRPIGSGILLAAEMAGAAKGADVAAVLSEMQRTQAGAARILKDAHAMTDVTGFGLGGHLHAICKASGVGAVLEAAKVPVYQGAAELAAQGHHSSIYESNFAILDNFSGFEASFHGLLFDPQTSGGLLAAVDPKQADAMLAELLAEGYSAAIIGWVTDDPAQISSR